MYKEIVHEADDELSRVRWEFGLLDSVGSPYQKVYLARYVEEVRETRRHDYRTLKQWDRHGRFGSIPRIDVPLSFNIKINAIMLFAGSIRFEGEDE